MSDEKDESQIGLDAEVGGQQAEDTNFTFRTSNGKKVTLTYRQAKISTDFLKVAMDRNIAADKQSDVIDIPLDKDPNDETVNKLFEWMRRRNGEEMADLKKPIEFGYEEKEWIKNWGDVKTFNELEETHPDKWAMGWIVKEAKHRVKFYKLLFAADKFSLKGLLSLGCAYLACLLKFCKQEDVDRVLDPAITDGRLLAMRSEQALKLEIKKKTPKRSA